MFLEQIPGKTVHIFGANFTGLITSYILKNDFHKEVIFLDNNPDKQGQQIFGTPCLSPIDAAKGMQGGGYYLITAKTEPNQKVMKQQLESYGCKNIHILDYNYINEYSKKIDDVNYIRLFFYYNNMKYEIDLENPQTFNEKLQWLKLHDRKPEYTKMVDKYAAKEWVANVIGEKYVIPTLGVYDSFDEIDFEKLPEQFVLKCTHDSGSTIICHDKSTFDFDAAKEKLNKHLSINYYYVGREYPYKDVKPRIIAEKYMINGIDNRELIDYKFMCFDGKVKSIFTCTERFSEAGLKVTFFDNNWNRMPFERHYPASTNYIEKPNSFNEMIELAERLSSGIPFVRVDFYEVNNQPYFGEMTFYPGGGVEEFSPVSWDFELGAWITLNNY